MVWLAGPLIVFAIFLMVNGEPMFRKWRDSKIRIHELKVEEARENRLRAEAEAGQYEGN